MNIYQTIEAEKANASIEMLCRMFGVAESAFYAWQSNLTSTATQVAADEEKKLVECVREVFTSNRHCYGARRIRKSLKNKGIHVSRKRVRHLMHQAKISLSRRRRKVQTTDSNHSMPASPNLLQRDFTAVEKDRVWVGDITYVHMEHGEFAYVATWIDLYSRRVVGHATSTNIDANLVIEAFNQAVTSRRPAAGLIVHTDRGSQYASHAFREKLSEYGVIQSMSRRANCLDNAVAESMFATLKRELCDKQDFVSVEDVRWETWMYIEQFYNGRRLHSTLGYESPVSFERKSDQLINNQPGVQL